MTINVRLDKGSVTVAPEGIVRQGIDAREPGEDMNVLARRGAVVVVYPDGSSVDEIERLIDAAEARREA